MVLKAGGNVLYPRSTNYIDDDFIAALITYMARHLLHRYERLILVPGGVGGELFINWGRRAGCTEPQLDEIGCSLINMSAAILKRTIRKALDDAVTVCPIVPLTLDQLDQVVDQFQIIVAGCAIPHALTSDSLAASMAEHLGADLRIIKSAKPFIEGEGVYLGSEQRILSLSGLLAFHTSLKSTEVAGHHPSIDYLCLRILRRANLNAAIILKSDVVGWKIDAPVLELEILNDC